MYPILDVLFPKDNPMTAPISSAVVGVDSPFVNGVILPSAISLQQADFPRLIFFLKVELMGTV